MTEKELILTNLLDCPRHSLYIDRVKNRDIDAGLNDLLEKRKKGIPLQYLLGKVNFMGFDIKVDSRVLIPRFETEILVEKTIEIIQGLKLDKFRLLDLCTGSGCIAIALAKFFKSSTIIASDISKAALSLARKNAIANKVDSQIKFIESDLLQKIDERCYDIIICNPPYIKTKDIKGFQLELSYEPKIALDGGEDGLVFYRKIFKNAHLYLEKNGLLIFEIGFGQAKCISGLVKNNPNLSLVKVFKDYNNIERVMVIHRSHLKWIN